MTAPTFGTVTPRVDIPRHGGNGNPLILLPEYAGDAELAAILRKKYDKRTAAEKRAVKDKYGYYSRPSSFGKAIDDGKALEKWGRRMVAVGLTKRPDLMLKVTALAMDPDDNKGDLDEACEDAIEAAKASAAANTGTALHKLTEYVDQGVAVPNLPASAERDLAAYSACMERHGVTHHRTEQFVVCDELRTAGSFDRFMSVTAAGDTIYVGDIKTGNVAREQGTREIERDEAGRVVLAHVSSMAVQLALYANSSLYNPLDGSRTPLDVSTDAAVVIHLPQGLGECELWWLNIRDGWEAAHLAAAARDWQKRRDLASPIGRAS